MLKIDFASFAQMEMCFIVCMREEKGLDSRSSSAPESVLIGRLHLRGDVVAAETLVILTFTEYIALLSYKNDLSCDVLFDVLNKAYLVMCVTDCQRFIRDFQTLGRSVDIYLVNIPQYAFAQYLDSAVQGVL